MYRVLQSVAVDGWMDGWILSPPPRSMAKKVRTSSDKHTMCDPLRTFFFFSLSHLPPEHGIQSRSLAHYNCTVLVWTRTLHRGPRPARRLRKKNRASTVTLRARTPTPHPPLPTNRTSDRRRRTNERRRRREGSGILLLSFKEIEDNETEPGGRRLAALFIFQAQFSVRLFLGFPPVPPHPLPLLVRRFRGGYTETVQQHYQLPLHIAE